MVYLLLLFETVTNLSNLVGYQKVDKKVELCLEFVIAVINWLAKAQSLSTGMAALTQSYYHYISDCVKLTTVHFHLHISG